MKKIIAVLLASVCLTVSAQDVSQQEMQAVYDEVRTPYKYGLVVAPTDNYHKIDCPTVFRVGGKWLMTYVCYNGKKEVTDEDTRLFSQKVTIFCTGRHLGVYWHFPMPVRTSGTKTSEAVFLHL